MRAFGWIATALIVGLVCSAALAARGVVISKNGQTFEGEITEEPNHYVIMRAGITTRILRDDVASVKLTGPVEDEIKGQWAKLSRDDAAGRIALSRKAFQNGKYDLARSLANEAVAIDPNSRDAVDMLDLVRRQILLESRSAAAAGQRKVRGEGAEDFALPIVLMDDYDINAVRQSELQAADNGRVRVRFNNDVRRRYATQPGVDSAEFANLTAFQQAMQIIRDGTDDMRNDVVILDDPIAVRGFKSVQKSILTGCASVVCHGSMTAGNFILYPNVDSDAVTYTNFHLLMKYARTGDEPAKSSVFGGPGARLRMIDRERPGQSLLLQYAVPQNLADHPHPAVPLFRPLVTQANDALLVRLEDWIADSLRSVTVVHKVRYVSPIDALIKPLPATTTTPTSATPAPVTAPATRPVVTSRPSIPMPPPPPRR